MRLDPDAGGVAGVGRPVAADVHDVVGGVAGGREAVEPEHAVADDVDVLLRDRSKLAPQRVEGVAVEPPRACLEPRGMDEGRSADPGDVHLQAGMLPDEDASRAGVVEVDVREQEVADVGEREAALAEPFLQPLDSGGRPAVEERRTVLRVEQIGPDYSGGSLVPEVDRLGRHRAMLLAPIAARTTAIPLPVATALDGKPGRDARGVIAGACAGSPSYTGRRCRVPIRQSP